MTDTMSYPRTPPSVPEPPSAGHPADRAPAGPPPTGGERARGDRSGRGGWRGAAASALVAAVVATTVSVPVTRAIVAEERAAAPAAVGEGSPDGATDVPAPTSADGTGPVAAIAREVSPSVAKVEAVMPQGRGEGSAVVYREDGYLVTNRHVVANARAVQVVLPDGTTHDAEVVGNDESTDIAVLKIAETGLPVPEYATAAPVVGETAVAIGTPFGLEGSVTAGIVSALGRNVVTPGAPLIDMIQTDASINPGNSGGALVNGKAEVIGINTAILSPTGTNNGIGFAIPTAIVRDVADELITHGVVRHAFLGVSGTTVDPEVADLYGLATREGAVVVAVEPGSPAAEAGLQRGDIVVGVGGEDVASMEELAARIRQHRPGAEVEIEVVREGETLLLDVALIERPTSDEG